MGKPKVYESNAQRQQAYRRRRAAEGKTINELAEDALVELHAEIKAEAACGDDDRARFAKCALGRSPLETAIKVIIYAEYIDPTYGNDGAFGNSDNWLQAEKNEELRCWLRHKAECLLTSYLEICPSKLQLKLKYWEPRYE